MLRRLPTLSVVRHELRAHVCDRCPGRLRSGGPPCRDAPAHCEATCPIFTHLEALVEMAERLDPALGTRRVALRRRIDTLCSCRAVPRAETQDMAAAVIAAAIGN